MGEAEHLRMQNRMQKRMGKGIPLRAKIVEELRVLVKEAGLPQYAERHRGAGGKRQ